jgi:hypothetical protein
MNENNGAGERLAARRLAKLLSQEHRAEACATKKKVLTPRCGIRTFIDFIPATTYVPTQLPVQYHRPGEA